MKRKIVLAIAVLTVAVMGCKKLAALADINIDIPYTQKFNTGQIPDSGITIPAGGISISLPAMPIATNSAGYIDSNKTVAEKILRVYLKSLALQIDSPATGNFDYLDSVQIFVDSANSQSGQLIAYKYNIAKSMSALALDTVANINLKNYFLKDTMYVRLSGHFNALPPSNNNITLNTIFHMLANPLY